MLKKEWQAIFKHKFFIIVIIALSLVPAIYNYIFLGSMWDPYGKVKDLPVAVVNLDRTSELDGKKFKLGDDIIKEMKKTKDLDYHFVSKAKASNGIKKGDYYMVITFPENFSENASGLMGKSPKKVQLDYQTSRGHNYISSKMSESAINQLKADVSENITQEYTTAILSKVEQMKSGMKTAADGSQKLADGTASALSGSNELSSNLRTLASSSLTFADGADSLSIGLAQYTTGVGQAANGGQQLSSGLGSALTGSERLSLGSTQAVAGTQQLSAGLDSAASGSQQLADGVNQSVNGSKKLSDGTGQFSTGIGQLALGTQTLTDKSKDLSNGMAQISDSTAAVKKLQAGSQELSEGLNQLNAAVTGSATAADLTQLETGLTALDTALKNLATTPVSSATQDLATQMQALTKVAETTTDPNAQRQLATSLSAMGEDLKKMQAEQTQALASLAAAEPAVAGANKIVAGFAGLQAQTPTLAQGGVDLNQGLTEFNSQFATGAQELTTGFNQFAAGLDSANSGAQQLADKSQDLQSGSQALTDGLGQLQSGSASLTTGLTKLQDGSQSLNAGLNKLQTGSGSLTSGLHQLQTGGLSLVTGLKQLKTNSPALLSGANQLTDGAGKISDGSGQLANGGIRLSDGLSSLNNGSNQLSSSLGTAHKELAATNSGKTNAKDVAAPLTTKHSDHDNVPVNGAGMTPYMINVALFIGALATNVVIGVGFSGEKWKTGREFMWAKIGTNGVVALLQAIIVCGAVDLLGLSPNHWWETFLAVILISFAYMAINTFFLTWLGKIGEFSMIVVLVLQLATSAGTYPLQLAPKLFQVISPWLPMTYGLRMMRETIGLTGEILPYILIFVGITLFFTFMLRFFKRFSRFA